MPQGKRKIPPIPPCSNYTLGGKPFSAPFPLSPPQLQVAEAVAELGHPRAVGLSPSAALGACQKKWGREGLSLQGAVRSTREVEELSWSLQPAVSVLQLDLL